MESSLGRKVHQVREMIMERSRQRPLPLLRDPSRKTVRRFVVVLSQSMDLKHMKDDDEFRVRGHGCVLSSTPTKPTSVGTFILSLRGRGFAAAQCLAAPISYLRMWK